MARVALGLLLAGLALVAGAALAAGPRTTPAAAERVELTITFRGEPGRAPRRATLRCGEGARGTAWLRRPATARTACRRARARDEVLAGEASPGTVCTEVYGGPQTARVSGRVGGRRVDGRFGRSDGCQISTWDELVPLLPRPAG